MTDFEHATNEAMRLAELFGCGWTRNVLGIPRLTMTVPEAQGLEKRLEGKHEVNVCVRVIDLSPDASSYSLMRKMTYAIVPVVGDHIEIVGRCYDDQGEETISAWHDEVVRRYVTRDVKGDEAEIELHVDVRAHNVRQETITDMLREGWEKF